MAAQGNQMTGLASGNPLLLKGELLVRGHASPAKKLGC
jgi:hypothetical protein